MIAWWSVTFASLTTRCSGSDSSADHVLGALAVLRVVADQLGGRLDLRDQVAGQEARVGTRVGDRLVLLVERCAADSVRRAEKPYSVFAWRWSEVRS